jgi:hypothetical protein
MGSIQAKADANLQELREDMKADQAKVDASIKEIRAGQERLKEEMFDRMDSQLEKM